MKESSGQGSSVNDAFDKRTFAENEEKLNEIFPQQLDLEDLLEKSGLDEEKRVKILRSVAKYYSGPLPSPDSLERYNSIPGAVEVILNMATAEMTHRHEIETKLTSINEKIVAGQLSYVKESMSLKKRIQFFGFIITIMLIIASFVCIFCDKSVAGVVSFIGAIGGFVSVMFWKNSKEDVDDNDSEEDVNSSTSE